MASRRLRLWRVLERLRFQVPCQSGFCRAWFPDIRNDGLSGSAGQKNLRYAASLQGWNILLGNNASCQHQHVVEFLLLQKLHHSRQNDIVRARKNGEPDAVNVFLESGIHDLFRRLPQPGIDHFHPRVTQGTSNNLCAAVVAIQSGLGNENPQASVGHSIFPRALQFRKSARCRFQTHSAGRHTSLPT